MAVLTIVLLCLLTGIIVGLKSKKLTVTELVVCGSFGLLLGSTKAGSMTRDLIQAASDAAQPIIESWLS